MNKKVLLMILDGWGIAKNLKVSAIDAAKTPYINSLYKKYTHSKLQASGLAVGLPEGQMGNSEVGHMNIGAGRVIYQMLTRIDRAVADGSFARNPALVEAIEKAKASGGNLPLLRLVSHRGVHPSPGHPP